MARRAASALIVTLIVLATPLRAQPASPGDRMDRMAARLPSDPSKVTVTDSMRIMDQFGQCLVGMRARLADVYAGPYPRPITVERARNEEGIFGCMQLSRVSNGMRVQFNFEHVRGAVYKARYRQRHRASQPNYAASQIDWTAITVGMDNDMARRFVIIQKVAECALAAAPAPAHQLVMADYGSDAQKAAFAKLAPVIGDCLPEGLTLELPRPALAAALAEVAYKKAAPAS